MINYCISCDWLQVYCKYYGGNFACQTPLFGEKYTITKCDYSTPQFREVYVVHDVNGIYYADVLLRPVSSVISSHGCLVRLANSALYSPTFADGFVSFLSGYDLIYQNISRLDVCYDCNLFNNGMRPDRLIRSFLGKKILKNGQTRYTLSGSVDKNPLDQLSIDLFDVTTSSPYLSADAATRVFLLRSKLNEAMKSDKFGNFSIHGTSTSVRDFSYIMFGSRSSAACSYMYDKTKELAEVKDKPYIRELWALNGIDASLPVWRVEISIKSTRSHYVCLDTGELLKLTPSDLKFQSDLENIFVSYADKYFHFKENNLKANKTRMKTVPLFPSNIKPTIRPISLTTKTDSTKADKVFLTKLSLLPTSMRHLSEEGKSAIKILSRDFIIGKNLSRYMYYKVLPKVSEAERITGRDKSDT